MYYIVLLLPIHKIFFHWWLMVILISVLAFACLFLLCRNTENKGKCYQIYFTFTLQWTKEKVCVSYNHIRGKSIKFSKNFYQFHLYALNKNIPLVTIDAGNLFCCTYHFYLCNFLSFIGLLNISDHLRSLMYGLSAWKR